MATKEVPRIEATVSTSKVREFTRKYMPLKALQFYGDLIAAAVCVTIVALPPYHLHVTMLFAVLAFFNLELAYYHYLEWKPEKSKAFELGASAVIELIHTNGTFKYKRDGQEYAIYSNKVKSTNK